MPNSQPGDARGDALTASLLRPNQSFNSLLDFLRAAAVTLVVLDHTTLALGDPAPLHRLHFNFLGLVGVWIFFVHTALVLMWSLERKPFTLDFYVRRLFRIYPLALVAIAVALLTRAPLLGTTHNYFEFHPTTPGNLLATAFLVQNLAPASFHFHPIVNTIWTLPLEVDMYLALPVLFAFARRERSVWPLLLLWAVSAAWARVYFAADMNLSSAVPFFLSGVIAYVRFMRVRPRWPAWAFPPFLAVLLALILLKPRVDLGWLFALALALCLPCFHPFRPSRFTWLTNRIARYSFGVYLVHPFALVLGMYVLRGHSLALQLAVEFATIVVVSVAAYHLIEKPMIDLGAHLAARLERRTLRSTGPSSTTLEPLSL